jgi:pyruvate kinase
MRLTKIVCTLGPASSSPENILKMLQSGMNVARINFSHGDHETHGPTIRAVKKISEEHGYDIPLMLDTKGPEIRTGDVKEPIAVKKGEDVLFTFDKEATYDGTIVHVNYPEFGKDVEQAEAIIVDNGDMSFEFVKKNKDGSVVLKANQDGMIGNRRHVNLPGANVSLPSITDKDWKDLEFGVQENMDLVALSFVRSAADVEEVRAFLKKKGSDMKIMSKIENRQSVENIGEIIDASDAIMVARGDLGAEMPFQKIPAVQDMIVRMCRAVGKPVIVATQMLESMIKNPMPTRAEVTDVTHAVLTGTDMTMLSGETAAGKYPFESVKAMSSILQETEARMGTSGNSCGDCDCGHAHEDSAVRAEAAVTMAHSAAAKAIVILCNTGRTADLMSVYRPGVPVYAFSDSPALRRQLQMRFGITPVAITMESDGELNIERAMSIMEKNGHAQKGDRVVVVARTQVRSGPLVTVHLRQVG